MSDCPRKKMDLHREREKINFILDPSGIHNLRIRDLHIVLLKDRGKLPKTTFKYNQRIIKFFLFDSLIVFAHVYLQLMYIMFIIVRIT